MGERVKLRSTCPVLYSGSTLTTFINNLASALICESIALSDINCISDIEQAALRVGYKVSIDACNRPCDLQFLKHSPAGVTMFPLLNVGVLLRASGFCRGDLPGRGDLEKRASRQQAMLLNGMYPHVSFPFLHRLKATCKRTDEALTCEKSLSDKGLTTLTNEEVFERYTLSNIDYIILDSLVTGYQQLNRAEVFDKIMAKDYSYPSTNTPSLNPAIYVRMY